MPLVPSYIKKLASYKPGSRIDDVKRDKGLDRVIKLSSNENSLGPAPLAITAIESAMQKVNRYPDASGLALRTKLSRKFDVKIEFTSVDLGNIIVTGIIEADELNPVMETLATLAQRSFKFEKDTYIIY